MVMKNMQKLRKVREETENTEEIKKYIRRNNMQERTNNK